jgi:uncharacterized protein YutE (UPF0331/DUF86 family)
MTNVTSAEHNKKISQLAAEYQSHGYEIEYHASLPALPKSLEGFKPDLIARRGDETVVFEIKSHAEMSENRQFKELATYINSIPGWRLEVAVVKPKRSAQAEELELIDLKTINSYRGVSDQLISQKYYGLALIVLWTSVEAALRHLAKNSGIKLRNESTQYTLKKLFSYGLLSKKTFHSFEECLSYRNQLIHGYKSSESDVAQIEKMQQAVLGLIKEVDRLIRQKEAELAKGLRGKNRSISSNTVR